MLTVAQIGLDGIVFAAVTIDVERCARLENEHLSVTIDRLTGGLVGFASAEDDWQIQGRPELALSFRLLVPLPDRRNNMVVGIDQEPPVVMETRGRLLLRWDDVRSEHGGEHAIGVTETVTLADGGVVFELSVDNQSDLTVENAWSPCFGDLRPPGERAQLTSFMSFYGTAIRQPVLPVFESNCGYWGVDVPSQVGGQWIGKAGMVPVSPFMLLLGEDQGLYMGVAARRWDVVAWWSELHPGYEESMQRLAPALGQIGGHDVAIRVAAAHAPFVLPGESRDLTPILVEPFRGDWHAGADVYRRSSAGWVEPAMRPAWTQEPHSWLQCHINSPEDELRVPFRELGALGRECAEAGISSIQLVGWNDGGQDRGNPSHRPDPKLGTEDELRAAIREIQSHGIRVVLFAKLIWGDVGSDWFERELFGDAVKDPRGGLYHYPGWRYQTLTQLLDVNTTRFAPMCFSSEHYAKVCEDELDRMVGLGVDGALYDECCWHGAAALCFDGDHGHHRPAPVYADDVKLMQRLRDAVGRRSPDFLIAGEGLYDWQIAAYDLSYFRTFDPEHVPLTRYLHPHLPLLTAATGFDDRNMINQCLLYRYLVSYEPFNFKGRPGDLAQTISYGNRMDALRTELRSWFWDGTFVDTNGAWASRLDGTPHRPFSVFRRADTGEPGVVVANYDSEPIELRLEADELESPVYRLVDGADWVDASEISVPARSAAVVVASGSI
jgi:hypothetical protein